MLRGLLLSLGIGLAGISVAGEELKIETNLTHTGNRLEFDFPEVLIGTAEYPAGPTGTTLFYFPEAAQVAVDIRGSSAGTFFTQERMQQGQACIYGISLNGGGILGLEATSGAMASLYKKNLYRNDFLHMPLFSGAVIYDFVPRVGSSIYPDKHLGQIAFQSARAGAFPLGQRGAGLSATVGKIFGVEAAMPGGQGAAFAQYDDIKIAVFTVVNAMGVVLDENSVPFYGLKGGVDPLEFEQKLNEALSSTQDQAPIPGNTTLTVVITNVPLSPRQLQQLGKQVHNALPQVISPYGTMLDGDVLYAVSTATAQHEKVPSDISIANDMELKHIYLGILAGKLAKQAVWAAVGYAPTSEEAPSKEACSEESPLLDKS